MFAIGSNPCYMFWQSELPDGVCDEIIREGLKLKLSEAIIGQNETSEVNENIRRSKTSWISNDTWIGALTKHYTEKANRDSGWNFEIVGSEQIQFTVYQPGGFYDFHEDTAKAGEDYKYVRKLSTVFTITDPVNYDEGIFEFELGGYKPDIRSRGSILVFPSFLKHRVTPITRGTRYSLVNWFHGPQFK